VIDLVGGDDIGAILTFDDITELQSAQRKAAWADVARRIAHEIKNPLTPIQLSAERLRRKYLKQITDDPETFSQCTDTIIRHVGDIGRMVNEFSAFARMPEPIMHIENLAVQIRDLLTLQQQAHPEINFEFKQSTDDTFSLFDAQQLRQAITNLLNNAIDAIEAKQFQYKDNNEMSEKGSIQIILGDWEDYLFMSLSDNGVGLPKNEDFSRLTEPYVTYKDKGTGLGLAIVKKIMEDHGGRLILGVPEWLKVMNDFKDLKGATLTLILPRKKNKLDNSEIKTE
jgi:two-component system nitrogen regulation sensor histidine kinase NtrY